MLIQTVSFLHIRKLMMWREIQLDRFAGKLELAVNLQNMVEQRNDDTRTAPTLTIWSI